MAKSQNWFWRSYDWWMALTGWGKMISVFVLAVVFIIVLAIFS